MSATLMVFDAFMRRHPIAAARLLEKYSPRQLGELFEKASQESVAPTLEYMSADRGADCLATMEPKSAARLLAALHTDFQLAIMRVSKPAVREALLVALDDEISEPLKLMLRYPEGTVGELMDAFVFTVPNDITVQETLKRARAASLEVPFYVYVLDRTQRLVGVASLKNLIRAKRSDPVSSLMNRDVVALNPMALKSAMVKSTHWRSFHTLPVTEEDGVFLGVVRYETISRLREELGPEGGNEHFVDTALALGELYWVGLAGVMDGIAGRARDTTDASYMKPKEGSE
ncbi:MAG TPA: CBS domain-containing protein [Gammaproteobacteria bacterium]|nr:CBS domain-containing protein [Gammaproteobacteria bacterium]